LPSERIGEFAQEFEMLEMLDTDMPFLSSDYVVQDDFMKAVRKQADAKKHESGLDYKAV
jgi:hypothetical protein